MPDFPFPVRGVNAGVTDESRLRDYNSPSTKTVTIPDGTDLSDRIVYGEMKYADKLVEGVYGRNVLLRGGPHVPTGNVGCIHSRNKHTGTGRLTLENFEIRPQRPHAYRNGVMGGHRMTLRGGVITGGCDGIDTVAPTDGSADVDFIGETIIFTSGLYTRPDPYHGDEGSHFDCWQHHFGRKASLSGCLFDITAQLAPGSQPMPDGRGTGDMAGSGIVWCNINPKFPADKTVKVASSWFKGGSAHIYLHEGITGTIEYNQFSTATANRYWIRKLPGAGTFDGLDGTGGNRGNVWWDGASKGQLLSSGRYNGIESL